MQNLFQQIEASDSPNLLSASQIYHDVNDLQDKNPKFYKYLLKNNIEIKPEHFPFSIIEESKGMLLDETTKVMIVRAEEIYNQFGNGTDNNENRREIGGHSEIFKDFKIAKEKPNTYVMIATNGCRIPKEKRKKLESIRSVKQIGYGLPILPQDLIEDVSKIPGLYIVENGTTQDYEGRDYFTAYLAFDLKQSIESDTIKTGIESVIYFDFNGQSAAKILSNPAFCSELNPNRNNIMSLTIAIAKNPVLVSALHDLRSKIIGVMTSPIISIIQENSSILNNTLTPENMENLEQFDIEDDNARREILSNLIYEVDNWLIMETKLKRFENTENIDRDDKLVEKFYPEMYELNLKLKTFKSLDKLLCAYERLFNFYRELRDPKVFCSSVTEASTVKDSMYLLSWLVTGLWELRNYINEDKPECINDKIWKQLRDIVKLGLDDFADTVRPEITSMIQDSVTSPLYNHYEKYLEIEKEKSQTPGQLNVSAPISDSISVNSILNPEVNLSLQRGENNEAGSTPLFNAENNSENMQASSRGEGGAEQNQNNQTDRDAQNPISRRIR